MHLGQIQQEPTFARRICLDVALELLLVSRVAARRGGVFGVDGLVFESLNILVGARRARARLPCGHTGLEDLVHLLERLAGSLGERQEDVDGHGHREAAKNDVALPLNVVESGRDKVAESKVERPVTGGGDRVALASQSVTEEFGNVDPRDRAPCGCKRGDEQVGAGNDGFGSGTLDFPSDDRVVRVGIVVTVACHETGDRKEPNGHKGRTDQESGATAPSVDIEERRHGHEDVDDVLNPV